MAALVQAYPQQSGSTVTMLQTRPSSASGMLQNVSQNQHQFPQTANHMHRNSFHGLNNGMGLSNYRGQTTMAPIAPYAFTSTPTLTRPGQSPPHLQQRTASAPIIPTVKQPEPLNNPARSRYPAPASVSTTSSSSSSDLSSFSHKPGSQDDSAILSTARVPSASGAPRPQSTVITTSVGGNLAPPVVSSPAKSTPDRYRRPNNRRADSSTTNASQSTTTSSSTASLPNVVQFYGASTQQPAAAGSSSFNLQMPSFTSTQQTGKAADDMQLPRAGSSDTAKRYRRRSINTIDVNTDFSQSGAASSFSGAMQQGSNQVSSPSSRIEQQSQHPLRSSPILTVRPISSHGRSGSTESVDSSRSRANSQSSSANKREPSVSTVAPNPAPSPASEAPALKLDVPKTVNIPARASSSDAAKRITNPSPLSKPMTMSPEASTSKDSFASAVNAALQQPTKPTYAQVVNGANVSSPAAKQLAALNEKDSKKSKTSRLRRAFSFGSAQELRRASAENSAAANAAAAAPANATERAKLRKDKYDDDEEAKQAKIAEKQEAGGIGASIYSGQGNFFSGSTDNLSISSTASSASVMIRKMGKGMKKSTRSLVGLFRPKSVIGVPAADSALPEASQAQVSMVTVEAEREKVNVNANPHDQVGGGTGYPRLERNSIDTSLGSVTLADRLGSSSTENSGARRSIVGGEMERAEVLAAVKKGILKRTGTDSGNSSPVIRPSDQKPPNFQLPQIPHVNDTPNSSAPSTPNDEQPGHRRTGSVTLGGEDYFMTALRFSGNSKSMPNTPQGTVKRNATFSPRIQFHDTWPSGEYDRRGEIATCNRLTPMLAQQIKEELNTFKMEMEVHENSKIYTHFF